jgi:hypothetical protein
VKPLHRISSDLNAIAIAVSILDTENANMAVVAKLLPKIKERMESAQEALLEAMKAIRSVVD